MRKGRVRSPCPTRDPGSLPEQAAFIFDKYRQADTAAGIKVQGTGLGLAIVKHIVQDHGGTSVGNERRKAGKHLYLCSCPPDGAPGLVRS